MYYKVIKNDRVIDVLDKLIFVKYCAESNRMLLCTEDDAQGFLSSDQTRIWHEVSLYKIPIPGYDTVKLLEIDIYEYEQLKRFNYKTPEELIDAYTLEIIQMLEGGVVE